jgi:hypothetical protein
MGGMPDILVGMHTLPTNTITLDIVGGILESRQGQKPEFFSQQTQEYWNQKKDYIRRIAETAPSHYQYLKDNIYDGKDLDFSNTLKD